MKAAREKEKEAQEKEAAAKATMKAARAKEQRAEKADDEAKARALIPPRSPLHLPCISAVSPL